MTDSHDSHDTRMRDAELAAAKDPSPGAVARLAAEQVRGGVKPQCTEHGWGADIHRCENSACRTAFRAWGKARDAAAGTTYTPMAQEQRDAANKAAQAHTAARAAARAAEVATATPAPAPKRTRRPRKPRKCVTGGNCSSFGTGRTCGAPDCDGNP